MTKSGDWVPNNSASKDRTASVFIQQKGGYSLSGLLAENPAPTSHIIPIFQSVIAAMEQAHLGNTDLCDLNPQKIFLRDDGTIELSSLKQPASGMTAVLGSMKYCAPEMVEDAAGQSSERALIESYVLGFVFYEILLGRDLFEKQFENIHQHGEFGWLAWHADKTKRAQPLNKMIGGFPLILSNLIDSMMAKEAARRMTDLRRIAGTIDNSSQATAVIRLSALRDGETALASMPKKVDIFWRNFVRVAGSRLRELPWSRFFTGKYQKSHSNVSNHVAGIRKG
jgi:serine/threonine protein kinase